MYILIVRCALEEQKVKTVCALSSIPECVEHDQLITHFLQKNLEN